jgi:site-specific DNA recombinase
MTRDRNQPACTPSIRCGVYTRKSTSEGLDQEFNSLDAQREAAEAYITSQRHEGWEGLPDRYDDGGYTGGNTDRPALRRLIADIAAGKIGCVVVYKVDRLSRSLRDFLSLMELFQKYSVMFVSVTQAFNTATSMGRLMLNVLLSFAQFEREIISERTRDKMAAARRKGHWLGGMPILGYDVVGTKLVINEAEAQQVRQFFALYLEYQGLIPVVQELERRTWLNKRWTTRDGRERGGKPFTKTSLHRLLTNVTYIGKTRYKRETYDGKHEAIIDAETWQRIQALLARNGRTGGRAVRNKFGALLKGILRCATCNCAMSPTHSTKDLNKRYRYYRCQNAQQRGRGTCPSPSIPAREIERIVVDQIRCICKDPTLVAETVRQARSQSEQQIADVQIEQRVLERDLAQWSAETRNLLGQVIPHDIESPATARLADLQERICATERRIAEIHDQLDKLRHELLDERQAIKVLDDFDPVWEALTPREQVRLIELLVERVEYDGPAGKVSITFRPTGLKSLASTFPEHAA